MLSSSRARKRNVAVASGPGPGAPTYSHFATRILIRPLCATRCPGRISQCSGSHGRCRRPEEGRSLTAPGGLSLFVFEAVDTIEVAIRPPVVEPVADDETVREDETDVVRLDLDLPPLPFVDEDTGSEGARVSPVE